MKKLLIVALIGFGLANCQDAKFNRGGSTKKASDDRSNPNSTDPSKPNFTDPNNGSNPGNSGGGGIILPNGGGIITGNKNPWIINDPNNPFFEPFNSNPFFRSFGGGSVIWHIGDSAWDASSCKFKIDTRSLGLVQGRRFCFYFNVLNDNTTVTIGLKYCGVDYVGSKATILGPNGANDIKATRAIDLTTDWLGIFTPYKHIKFQTVTLNRGWHRVAVVSVQQGTDLDNYLIGRINLDPNKQIDLGDVREE